MTQPAGDALPCPGAAAGQAAAGRKAATRRAATQGAGQAAAARAAAGQAALLASGAAACLSWAVANVLSKHLLATMAPLALLLGQLAASVAALLLAAALLGRLPPWRRLPLLAAPGLLQPGLTLGLGFAGLAQATASVESLLFGAETPLLLLFGWVFLRERPSRVALLLTGLATAGVALVALDASAGADATPAGILLILGGVVSAALYGIAVRRLAEPDPLTLVTGNQIGGLAGIALLCALTAPAGAAETGTLPDGATLALLALSGLLMHALPLILFAGPMQRASLAAAALLLTLIPVATASLAALALGERLSGLQLTGGGIVILSLVLLPLLDRAPPAAPRGT